MSLIIGIDFDGTIVDHEVLIHDVPQVGKPVPGAIESLQSFQDLGAKIILWTMRSHYMNGRDHLTIAIDYIAKNGINLYGVNSNPSQCTWTMSPKLHADLIIDDVNFGIPLIQPEGFVRPCVDWSLVRPEVENLIKRAKLLSQNNYPA